MNTSLVLIEGGIHDEGGNSVDINLPISIAGESRDHCIVIVGLEMKGKKKDGIFKADSTVNIWKWSLETTGVRSILINNYIML